MPWCVEYTGIAGNKQVQWYNKHGWALKRLTQLKEKGYQAELKTGDDMRAFENMLTQNTPNYVNPKDKK